MLNNMKKPINIQKKNIINEDLNIKLDIKDTKIIPLEIKKLLIKDDSQNNIKLVDIDYINNRINNEFCIDTINKLKDTYLINEYIKCKSVQNEINKLKLILEKYNIESDKKNLILNDYILELIPAGTKGVIRGNKFNSIVKDTINNLKLNTERFEIDFEKHCQICITSEIPDWFIIEKSTNKVIIGMNQLDLVSGGQQMNRGYKYLIDNKHNTLNSKLLCVICNYIQFKTHNKKTTLFEVGFKNNTLSYLKNLGYIINTFFN